MNTEFSNIPISKRALELQDITDKLKTLWRPYEGTFENIFRLLAHLIPFVPGLGWGIWIANQIATAFGWGMSDFGGAIDKKIDTTGDVTFAEFSRAATSVVEDKKAEASTKKELIKVAWVGGLLKLVMGLPRVLKIFWEAIKALLLMAGVTHIGDLRAAMTGTTKMPGEILLDEMEAEKEEKPSTLMSEEDVKGLMGLITDPAKLIRPFTG